MMLNRRIFRATLRKAGLRPITTWVPDTRRAGFAEECRRQSFSLRNDHKGGLWGSRYYQDSAINAALEAIAENRQRILLTLATGTGKTFIAFQLAWKLFHARWNQTYRNSILVRPEPVEGQNDAGLRQAQPERPIVNRTPRILFLADRNILADQAYNSFSAFPEDALVRIAPEDTLATSSKPSSISCWRTT